MSAPEPARVACRAALAVGAQVALFTALFTAARLGDDVNDGRYRGSSGAQRNLQSVTGGGSSSPADSVLRLARRLTAGTIGRSAGYGRPRWRWAGI
jgi:hypothetical protein